MSLLHQQLYLWLCWFHVALCKLSLCVKCELSYKVLTSSNSPFEGKILNVTGELCMPVGQTVCAHAGSNVSCKVCPSGSQFLQLTPNLLMTQRHVNEDMRHLNHPSVTDMIVQSRTNSKGTGAALGFQLFMLQKEKKNS